MSLRTADADDRDRINKGRVESLVAARGEAGNTDSDRQGLPLKEEEEEEQEETAAGGGGRRASLSCVD